MLPPLPPPPLLLLLPPDCPVEELLAPVPVVVPMPPPPTSAIVELALPLEKLVKDDTVDIEVLLLSDDVSDVLLTVLLAVPDASDVVADETSESLYRVLVPVNVVVLPELVNAVVDMSADKQPLLSARGLTDDDAVIPAMALAH